MVKRTDRMMMGVGILMTIFLVFGCGGSDDEAASAPLTKAEFIKRAEAICTQTTRRTREDAAAWKNGFAGGAAEAEEHADEGLQKVLIPALEREAEQLEALQPPAKDKAVVAQFVANLSRASGVLKREGFDALPQSGAMEFRQEATAYGAKSCGGAL